MGTKPTGAVTLTRSLLLVFCACSSLVQIQADWRSFTVANEGQATVTEVYALPDFRFQGTWGAEWLGDDVVSPGTEYLVVFDGYGDHCMFHIRLVDTDSTAVEHRDVNLCGEAPRLVFSESIAGGGESDEEPLRFTVVNRSDTTVFVVQASFPADDDWGPDRLGQNRVVASGAEAVMEVADHGGQCVFDVRIVARDREGDPIDQVYMGTDLCAVEHLVFAAVAPPHQVTVVNQSSMAVFIVQASPPWEDDWGDDRLGPDGLIPAGTEALVEIDGHGGECSFDVRVTAGTLEGERVQQTYPQTDICSVQRLVFGPSDPSRQFSVVNQTNESIRSIFAAVDSNNGWDEDRLGTDVLSAGEESIVAIGSSERCVFDIRVIGSHSIDRTFDDYDVCQNDRIVLRAPAPEPELDAETTRVAGQAFRDCQDWRCPWMVVIEPGAYLRGSMDGREDEIPISAVTITQAFAVGESEVTVGQFREFVSATDRSLSGDCSVRRRDSWVSTNATWENPGFPQGDAHPVVCVTWDDASAYAAWVAERTGHSYRLLSEAEWEYVARKSDGGRERNSGWANCGDCGSRWDRKGTSPIGSFPVDALGLRNVLGNAWEWVRDCYADTYANAPRDGTAWDPANCSRRVLRGGSWFTNEEAVRASIRNRSAPNLRHSSLGFRLARDL